MNTYKKYQHLERFDRDAVNGLFNGECFIFPKLDGTSGQVWLEDEKVRFGSRNREIHGLGKEDNKGFRQYIESDIEKYEKFFEKYPDYRLFGEWLVPHSLKSYEDSAWRKFYVFDIVKLNNDESSDYIPYFEYSEFLKELKIDFIPLMLKISNPDDEKIIDLANSNTYLMKEGFFGEGVVIKNYSYKNKFNKTVWGKFVRKEFKAEHFCNKDETQTIEEKIIEKYCTDSLVEKTKAKIENAKGIFENKMLPELFNRVYRDIIVEDMWDIVKKMKNPKISFSRLNRLIIEKCKNNIFSK